MVNGGVHFRAGAGDLGLERGDALPKLLDRTRVQIRLRQLGQRIDRLARKELVEVHAARIPCRTPSCQASVAGMPAMIAIDPAEAGGPEVLRAVERAVPEPGPGEVLIKVAAAGVTPPDVMQRRGLYPPPPGAPSIPGLEVAGTIAGGSRDGEAVC